MQDGVKIITKDIETNVKIKQDLMSCFIFLKKFVIIYIENKSLKGCGMVNGKTK